MPGRGTSPSPDHHRPALPVLAAVCLLIGFLIAPPGVQARDRAELELGEPYRQGDRVLIDFELRGLFDGHIMEALDSGLPATLVFEWQVWRIKDGWWDRAVDEGQARYRVFYDTLDDRYEVFDGRGRSLGSCEAIGEVEGIVCQREGLLVTEVARLRAEDDYYVEMTARLEPLDDEEFRDLEGWLDEDSDGVLSWVSRQTVGVFKGAAGLSDRSIKARSERFRGWD